MVTGIGFFITLIFIFWFSTVQSSLQNTGLYEDREGIDFSEVTEGFVSVFEDARQEMENLNTTISTSSSELELSNNTTTSPETDIKATSGLKIMETIKQVIEDNHKE